MLATNCGGSGGRWNGSIGRLRKACGNLCARWPAKGSTQEDLITVRGERFVIPVKAEFRRKVPGVIHGRLRRGQTVFVEPLETIEQNNELQRLLDEEQREMHRILVAMTHAIGVQADAILLGTSILAEVESHFARARFANELELRAASVRRARPRLSLEACAASVCWARLRQCRHACSRCR